MYAPTFHLHKRAIIPLRQLKPSQFLHIKHICQLVSLYTFFFFFFLSFIKWKWMLSIFDKIQTGKSLKIHDSSGMSKTSFVLVTHPANPTTKGKK